METRPNDLDYDEKTPSKYIMYLTTKTEKFAFR